MKTRAGRIVRFILRWTIALLGIAWVLTNVHLRDHVLVLDDKNLPVEHTLSQPAGEADSTFVINTPSGPQTIPGERVINGPDRKTVLLHGEQSPVPLLGMRLSGPADQKPDVVALLVADPANGAGRFVGPNQVRGGFELDVPQPRVEVGAISMVRRADGRLLIGAFAVIPFTVLFTTLRWHRLLRALGIGMSFRRAFALNMVGAFYNTFMPGSTGGDLLKAYYAAKAAPQRRTAAVMSVIIDRVLGLLALIILGGSMAAIQYASSNDRTDPTSRACLQVAMIAATLLSCALLGLWLIYSPWLRRVFLINLILQRVPMKDKVEKVIEVLRLYRERPALILWAVLVTIPVHATVVVSAMFAGKAFDLPLSSGYYFIVVPVVVLVGAIPISPQGVGVMEAFAYFLTRQQGATVNQALALTMSIRLVQIAFNLLGGLFVLRGGYHSPSEQDQQELAPTRTVDLAQ
jgi:uncharacterized protein (TIRG00374 family)